LRRVIVGYREGHQLLQRQVLFAVDIHQERADAGQFQALGDQQYRRAKPLRDLLDAAAIIDQSAEGLKLIGRMHRLPHVVLLLDSHISKRDPFQWVSGRPASGHQVLPQSSQVTLVTHIFRRPD
jgi:hypothetical protein